MIFLHPKERLAFRRIINHWKKTGCVSDRESLTRSKNEKKITEAELETLDQLIILNRETTALQAKRELNIRGSNRSEKNYSNSSDQLITT